MQKSIFISLVVVSVLAGCRDQDSVGSEKNTAKNQISPIQKEIIPEWVGKYQGTTPCMGCFSRCDECPGMSVDLTLKADQTFVLNRISLSGHNEIETIKGQMRFSNPEKTQIELENVTTRNLLFVDLESKLLEILEDQTANAYIAVEDFSLNKMI